jgi:cell division protein FtsI/penicillin-binding protein 2
MRHRILAIAIAALLIPATAPLGGGEAEAAPKKKTAIQKKVKANGAKKKGRSASRPRRPAAAAPAIVDDPSQPLGAAWKRHLDRYFAQNRPEFGAFVAIDVDTGAPVAVSEYTSNARVAHPATTAAFPAASIFKVITTAALLEGGAVKPGTSTCYSGGSHSLEPVHLKDSKRDRACRSLAGAFAHSTNAVFGKLAIRHLDAGRLVAMAERLGFNRVLRVGDLEAESRAVRPSGELGLARMAAGFTNSTLAPLHGAVLGAIVASGGLLPAGVAFAAKGGASAAAADPTGRLISADAAARIREMMVATSVDGTAGKHLARFRGHGGGVAVKTGTLTSTDGSGLFNTWMVGFFPASRPEFAFAALVSTKGSGPVKAGHLTRHAIDTFLKLKRARAGQS